MISEQSFNHNLLKSIKKPTKYLYINVHKFTHIPLECVFLFRKRCLIVKKSASQEQTLPLRRVASSIVLFLHNSKKKRERNHNNKCVYVQKVFFKKQSFPHHKHIIGNLRCFRKTKHSGLCSNWAALDPCESRWTNVEAASLITVSRCTSRSQLPSDWSSLLHNGGDIQEDTLKERGEGSQLISPFFSIAEMYFSGCVDKLEVQLGWDVGNF